MFDLFLKAPAGCVRALRWRGIQVLPRERGRGDIGGSQGEGDTVDSKEGGGDG